MRTPKYLYVVADKYGVSSGYPTKREAIAEARVDDRRTWGYAIVVVRYVRDDSVVAVKVKAR